MKYGKQAATVEIAIKNGGRDAYKPHTYGSLIIVERRILRGGGGSYKIKGKNGNVFTGYQEFYTVHWICVNFSIVSV